MDDWKLAPRWFLLGLIALLAGASLILAADWASKVGPLPEKVTGLVAKVETIQEKQESQGDELEGLNTEFRRLRWELLDTARWQAERAADWHRSKDLSARMKELEETK